MLLPTTLGSPLPNLAHVTKCLTCPTVFPEALGLPLIDPAQVTCQAPVQLSARVDGLLCCQAYLCSWPGPGGEPFVFSPALSGAHVVIRSVDEGKNGKLSACVRLPSRQPGVQGPHTHG